MNRKSIVILFLIYVYQT